MANLIWLTVLSLCLNIACSLETTVLASNDSLSLSAPINQNHSSPSSENPRTSSFAERAMLMYKTVLPCIKDSSHAHNKGLENMLAPAHDAEAHYHDLLNKTRIFRDIPMHKYHYSGPWIENHWINHFMSKPFEYFNGLVPLFVQFVDIHVYDFEDPARPVKNASIPTQKESVELLLTMLRHDVIYLVVSQDDQGIGTKLMSQFPNILVLSAGGYGHVPIPLIMGEINFEKPHVDNKYSTEVGFYGSLRPALSRSRMLHEFEGYARSIHLNYKTAQTNDWVKLMVDTKYNLAPRGYGRTSFRLAEIVQSGRVPVYMYDDVRWLPYEGTNMSISNYGFVGQMGRLLPTVNELKSTDDNKYTHKILAVKEVRDLFTYSGVIKQIEQFIADPLGPNGGYLRCTRLPDKDHRRLSRGYDLHNDP